MIEFIKSVQFTDIGSFFEYISPWKNNLPKGLIYRGHSSENYELIPSALRIDNKDNLWSQCQIGMPIDNQWNWETWQVKAEYDILRNFYRMADRNGLEVPISNRLRINLAQEFDPLGFFNPNQEQTWLPQDLLEVASLAQHYGLSTRLLDWTYDIYVALYFAFHGGISKDGNMIIWCLNKEYLSFLKPTVNRVNIDFITPHYAGNPNLKAQKGLFTHWPITIPNTQEEVKQIFGGNIRLTDRMPLNQLIENSIDSLDNQPVFHKLSIPCSEAKKGCLFLDKLGYDSGKVFPGYGGIAKQIQEKNKYCE